MESTPRRAGLFSSFRFPSWRSEHPAPDTASTPEGSRGAPLRVADAGRTPPAPRNSNIASPESPAKRASAVQMSSRRILEQPKGPSSRLSNVVNSTDFSAAPFSTASRTTNFTSSTPAPKAMTFSGATSFYSRPGAYSSATTPRNMFRQSTAQTRSAFSFSPRVPYNTMKESFPPTTPGTSLGRSTAELGGRGLSKTTSASLFQMRIPSPPPELSGEALAKQVPDQAGHSGSVYADEFLAHLVPSGFDDLQRRQWLCILDLRRLKYAADEIFTNKDWKLNILSFAKEYEKSRSMIMLRYGLYEFKTKPSAELEKEWQKSNGIPTSDEEARPNGAPAPGGKQLKRRAEDDLSRDMESQSTHANTNKRRVTERQPLAEISPVASGKRKASAVEEAEESQRAKAKKGPMASKNALDKIFSPTGKSQEDSPAKNARQPATASKTSRAAEQPSQMNGTFGSSPTKTVLANSNPFAHLAKPSVSADIADDSSENTEASEEETEENSEGQDASQSDEPSVAVSGGVSRPNFASTLAKNKRGDISASAASSASSESGEAKKVPSLFDRLSYGADGKALRVLGPDDRLSQLGSDNGRSTSPEKISTPFSMDQTWKPDSAIKFSGPGALNSKQTLFGTPAPASASGPSQRSEGSAETEGEGSGAETPKPAPSQTSSLFAPQSQAQATNTFAGFVPRLQEPAKSASPVPAAAAGGFRPTLGSEKPSENVTALNKAFSQPAISSIGTGFKPTPAASSRADAVPVPVPALAKPAETAPLAAPSFSFTTSKPEEKKPSGQESNTSSIFAPKSNDAATQAPKPNPVFQSSTLFGSANKPTSDEAAKSSAASASNLFMAKPLEASSSNSKPAQPSFQFGADTKAPTSNIFGTAAPTTASAAAPTSMDISPAKPASTLFGSSSGGTTLFGNASSLKRTASDDAEGDSAANASKRPVFGGFTANKLQSDPKPAQSQEQPTSLFNKPASSLFTLGGSSSQPAASAPQGGPAASFQTVATSFNSVASDDQATPFINPFAKGPGASAGLSFDFGAGGASTSGGQPGGGSFVFGGASSAANGAAAPSNTPFSFGAGAGAPTQSMAPTLSFGGDSQSQNTAGQPSSNLFGGASGGTSGGLFSFGSSQPQQPNGSSSIFSGLQKPGAPGNMFNLAPPAGGTSTGTSSPFHFGGASSLATTPATGTPEPETKPEAAKAEPKEKQADGPDDAEAPHKQISLAEGGPGEEDEEVLHEVRAKAVKFVMGGGSDSDTDGGKADSKADKKSPWKVQGVGPFRILKHKTTGAVRMLLRQEPSGRVAMNKALLPQFEYKVEPAGGKYVKLTAAKDAGSGLETWMLQVKTKEAAQALADALEANKGTKKA